MLNPLVEPVKNLNITKVCKTRSNHCKKISKNSQEIVQEYNISKDIKIRSAKYFEFKRIYSNE